MTQRHKLLWKKGFADVPQVEWLTRSVFYLILFIALLSLAAFFFFKNKDAVIEFIRRLF